MFSGGFVTKNNIIQIMLLPMLIANVALLFNSNYGWWLFFCLTLWTLILFIFWHTLFTRFKIKKRTKNPYSVLLINSLFIIFITTEGTSKAPWFYYIWLFIQIFVIVFSLFLWWDYHLEIKKKNGKLWGKKWLSGIRLRILQSLMIFLILVQAFVTFPYVFEPVIGWKSEQNKEDIQRTVDGLIEEYNCKTDEEKTIMLLNWFERHSGNMFNNWGIPTLRTGLIRSTCLSFGNGHGYFYLFCNFYIRPNNRDYPEWVFTTRSGRCDEHSILFREMASASGLEVRSIIGKEFDHLWAEVKINGTWITVDPSNVVHNKIWLDENLTGYNLSRKHFLSRFTKSDVSFIFAEYPNGTKVPVTNRYVENTHMVNITIVNENNKPMENVEVSIFSGSGLLATDFECKFTTDKNGKWLDSFNNRFNCIWKSF